MTVASAEHHLDATAEAYVADVLDTLEEHGLVTVVAAYILGSGALGGFDPERSDIDVVAVVDRPFADDARAHVIDGIGRLGCTARALELVVYVRGSQPPNHELNLSADASGARELPDEPWHWFVVDAAIAEERGVPFGDDERWSAFFEPIAQQRLREALLESIAWSARRPEDDEFARLNAARSRHYLESGEWLTKAEARKEQR